MNATGRRRSALANRLVGAAVVLTALFMLAGGASAVPVVGTNVLYTSDADFDKGTLVNVNHDAPNNNQLQVNETTSTFPFIWVSLSQRCTIAKINTLNGAILGEYRTISDAAPCNQSSRTTVALDGSVWVGHRGPGGVTHVGLVELNQCVDRNGNGTIETSTGYGDVKLWPGSSSLVADAQDECILHHVDTDSLGFSDTRHMSIDKNNNLWVGDFGGHQFVRVNGTTGIVETAPRSFSCGGYGGLIDKNGVIWSANGGSNGLLRWNPDLPDSADNPRCIDIPVYGLAIDLNGFVWAGQLSGDAVRKVSPDGNTILGPFAHGSNSAQGLAADANGDIWVSSSLFCGSGCTIGHLKNDGTFVGNVDNPTGAGSTGVAIDAAGKVWSTNLNSNTATRIDPSAGPIGHDGVTHVGAVDLTVDFPATPCPSPPATVQNCTPFPYNYSDMTGAQLIGVTGQGSWTVTQDGGAAGTAWGTVTWNTEPQGNVPAGASMKVEARTADTEAGLGAVAFTEVTNATPFTMVGRFIQVRVTLTANSQNQSPVLSDIRIQTVSPPPTGTISIADTAVTEGDVGTTDATFTVSLSAASAQQVTVDFATADDTATAPGDYTPASGTLTFAPGETTKTITVLVNGDSVFESDERFFVNLSNPVGATIADGQGQGTIMNDDQPAAAHDHFKCYKAKNVGDRFDPRRVLLTDEFNTERVKVVRPEVFCAPVDKDGSGINDPTAHLTCYRINDVRGDEFPKFSKREVEATDQFGTHTLELKAIRSLCLPAAKSPAGQDPGPVPTELDHYKCYKAEEEDDEDEDEDEGTEFEPRRVLLTDQFTTERVNVFRPVAFCNPVDKDGSGIADPTAHLTCYKIRDVMGDEFPKFQPRRINARDQFGVRGLRLEKTRRLCLPPPEPVGFPPGPGACVDTDNNANPDNDGDALCDNWETVGLDGDNDGVADLQLYDLNGDGTIDSSEQADLNHKDIYLEIDFMALHQPDAGALADVVAAFAAAPVTNPAAGPGVTLHIQTDEQALLHSDELAFPPCTATAPAGVPDFDAVKAASFGTAAERAVGTQVTSAKRFAFHYSLFVHNLLGLDGTSGCAEIFGNDFVVSLGSWSSVGGHPVGTRDEQAGTLMHEFGHNLNLRHGGADDINCKPNYLSVMTYTRQINGAPISGRPLDYSRSALPTLDEASLSEPAGVAGPVGDQTAYGPPPRQVAPADGPIDWNRDSDTVDSGVSTDINNVGIGGCAGAGTALQGHDDWTNLRYDFQNSGDFADGVHLSVIGEREITFAEVQELRGID